MPEIRHSFLPTVGEQETEMLATLGIRNIHELFEDIPSKFLLTKKLNIPEGLSEREVHQTISQRLERNWDTRSGVSFLGGGAWPHTIPEVVKTVTSRTEFLTAYTPYQAEISQGMLQALFEYQSLIAELVELPIVNASMYDWASALGEAALMTRRVTNRTDFLVPTAISPNRRSVLDTYTQPAGIVVKTIGFDPRTGQMNIEQLKKLVNNQTAGVYFENPSYLGFLQDQVDVITEIAHDAGALVVVGVDPISLGVIRPPGSFGADIVIGEGQPLGSSINLGGPLLGLFASQDDRKLLRQLPGRIIGLTTIKDGDERGFVMTVQAREQHIRREKATSNICSNQALSAITAAVYLSLLGPRGLAQLGKMILQLRSYAEQQLNALKGIQAPLFEAPHFKEFVVKLDDKEKSIRSLLKRMQQKRILAGIPLDVSFPSLGQSALVCITESHSQMQIDHLVDGFRWAMEGEK
ncbi:MAG: aminomethyl-transferring glycine dehydrogenase subunit GcvPA [Candidatus Hodarchaeota archaeon]